jgi:mRNA-degrading endonuclease toxin of MazEF toxin-antitoxin module
MAKPAPGEIWRVDLGLTAKVRPCLVMSDYPAEEELALVLGDSAHNSNSRKSVGICLHQIFSKTGRLSSSANPTGVAKPAVDEARRSDDR